MYSIVCIEFEIHAVLTISLLSPLYCCINPFEADPYLISYCLSNLALDVSLKGCQISVTYPICVCLENSIRARARKTYYRSSSDVVEF